MRRPIHTRNRPLISSTYLGSRNARRFATNSTKRSLFVTGDLTAPHSATRSMTSGPDGRKPPCSKCSSRSSKRLPRR